MAEHVLAMLKALSLTPETSKENKTCLCCCCDGTMRDWEREGHLGRHADNPAFSNMLLRKVSLWCVQVSGWGRGGFNAFPRSLDS